jgi:hypothetical protein
MAIEYKKDIIDNGTINYQFFVKNTIDNEIEEVWMIAPYHGDKTLDQTEFDKCREKLGLTNGD